LISQKWACPLGLPVLFALAACDPSANSLQDNHIGLSAPLGTPLGVSVDGLTVGHRLMAANEYELALDAYTRSISEFGVTSEVLTSIASANMKLGRLGQARQIFYAAVKKDDRNVSAWNNLGVTLIGLQEYAEAREAFKVAFGLDAGKSSEIRDNLLLLDKYNVTTGVEFPREDEFVLVRGGNGVYFLLSPKEQ
jgi:tetratricopeptide (TPR) repeat protein